MYYKDSILSKRPRKDSMASSVIGLVFISLILFGVIGWVMNIMNIISHINDPITAMIVLQGIGVLAAPLGAVLGWVVW